MTIDSMKVWESRQKGIFASIHKIKTKSLNSKTGDMVGLYVMPIDMSPTDSIKFKQNSLQCGDCPLKSQCYVNPVSVNSPWKSKVNTAVSWFKGDFRKPIRLGVYGDPGLVPLPILQRLVRKAPKHTGYSHQWHKIKKEYSEVLMASIDNLFADKLGKTPIELKRMANKKGYRTFRVVNEGQEIDHDEILCLNSSHGITCADCGLCSGNSKGNAKNIYILIHGPQNKVKSYQKAV